MKWVKLIGRMISSQYKEALSVKNIQSYWDVFGGSMIGTKKLI